jgi:outer membrane protein assembly factor BamB
MSRARLVIAIAAAILVAPAFAAEWPQWRGPNRDNICTETDLLKEWPEQGPMLLWKTDNIGRGFGPVVARDGRLYVLGYGEEGEYVSALDRGTGKEVWSRQIQEGTKQPQGMYWLSQRAPTVDADRVYAVTAFGMLVCIEADRGGELWRKNYLEEFGGKRVAWGYCDYPLVDGDRLIVTPGGPEAKIVALDKRTGDVIWKAKFEGADIADYSPILVAEIGGVRQYIQLLSKGLVSVDAKDGKLLWRYDKAANRTINLSAPVIRGDEIFCAGAYGQNNTFIAVKREEDRWNIDEKYSSREARMDTWSTGPVRIGDDFFLAGDRGQLLRAEWATGKLKESPKLPFDRASALLFADGRLYIRGVNHTLTLVEVAPKALTVRGTFKIASDSKQGGWTMPVISGGKLFVRDQDVLYCYDLRPQPLPAPRVKDDKPPVREKTPEPQPLPVPPVKDEKPSAKEKTSEPRTFILVPSPTDVVDRMLDLAAVKKTDVVADLGCGDGRILVAAAKRFGCKAVGYELDAECVERARALAKEKGVAERVWVTKIDILDVDLSGLDVVTLYLDAELVRKLVPQLEKLGAGSRIVSHQAMLPGIAIDKTVTMKSTEDGAEHTIHLYTAPLRKKSER